MIWLTGNSGSGKTTLAKRMIKPGEILLDGDKMRECWTLGFSKEDRWENNLRIAKVAKMLEEQGVSVIVATICPYKDLREEVKRITKCRFVYLEGGIVNENYPYEHI